MSTASPTDHDLPPLGSVLPGLYRHYKGGWYDVMDTVRCSETLQGMALYRALYGGFGLWVRPAAMFLESGTFAGKTNLAFDRTIRPMCRSATCPRPAPSRPTCARGHRRGLDLDSALRPPPPEPQTCCGRGCNGCVWEGFYAALAHWRLEAMALLAGVKVPG